MKEQTQHLDHSGTSSRDYNGEGRKRFTVFSGHQGRNKISRATEDWTPVFRGGINAGKTPLHCGVPDKQPSLCNAAERYIRTNVASGYPNTDRLYEKGYGALRNRLPPATTTTIIGSVLAGDGLSRYGFQGGTK